MRLVTILLLALAGLLIGGAVLAVGFYVGDYAQEGFNVSDKDRKKIKALPVPTPLRSSSYAGQEVEGVQATAIPFVAPSVSPTAKPVEQLITPAPIAEEPRLVLMAVPDEVLSGESFVVRWRIEGPADAEGETSLEVSSLSEKETENSSSSVSNNTSKSFGTFTVPEEFSADFSFGGDPSDVSFVFTAEVGGEKLQQEKTVRVR